MNDAYLEKYQAMYQRLLTKAEEQGSTFIQVLIKAKSISAIKPDYEHWLAECLEAKDWQGLNNLIFQTNRHDLLPSVSSGYDHCFLFLNLLNAFACGDVDSIERMFPFELGLTSNGYPFYLAAGNLFIALWYRKNGMDKEGALLKKALPKAEKFITTKKPQWERAATAYLLALFHEDIAEAQKQLQEVCKSYMRSDMAPMKKVLCVEAHGLYCLAQYLLPQEMVQQMEMPEYKNFSKEYAKWREEHPKPEPGLYFAYPAPMEIVNRMYLAPVAKTKLHQPYLGQENPYMSAREKKQRYLDLDGMLEEFVTSI